MQDITNETKQKLDDDIIIYNPFPGLRPFSFDESHLFFGRENSIGLILEKLNQHKAVCISGASGSGKSSIIRAGIIPALQEGLFTNETYGWKVISMSPSKQPLISFAKALMQTFGKDPLLDESRVEMIINQAVLVKGVSGVVDLIKQFSSPKTERFLLVVDNFEDLFKLRKLNIEGQNTSELFVKQLLFALKQQEIPIYAIISMRGDYISEIPLFPQLADLVNLSHVALPTLTRNELKSSLLGPAAIAGGKIDPQLIQKILNEVLSCEQPLPLMQHCMQRIWNTWQSKGQPQTAIGISDYNNAGGIYNSVDKHLEEIYKNLDEEKKHITEKLFKTITRKGIYNRGISNPIKLSLISAIISIKFEPLTEVINQFRNPDGFYIYPHYSLALEPDSVIQPVHESLIHSWKRLKEWSNEESQSANLYTKLADASLLYQSGKAYLWEDPWLEEALIWKNKEKPTSAWALQYNPAFERTMVFLKTSKEARDQQQLEVEKVQINKINKIKLFAGIASFVAMLFIVLLVLSGSRSGRISTELAQTKKSLAAEKQLMASREDAFQAAERERDNARQALIEAELKKIVAQKQTVISEDERQLALINAMNAIQEQEVARSNVEKLEVENKKAQTNVSELTRQSQLMDEKSKAEFKRRMLYLAQTMAVKSNAINDKNLKGLLAYQAYLFYQQNDGPISQPDIYYAMYSAMKQLRPSEITIPIAHTGAINAMVFDKNSNSLFTAGSDGKIMQRDARNLSLAAKSIFSGNIILRSLAVSSNGRYLACGTAQSVIQLFDLSNPAAPPKILSGHQGVVGSVCFTADNQSIVSSCSDDKSIRLWNVSTLQSSVFTTNESGLRSIAISPDGKSILGGTNDGKVILWDLKNPGDGKIIYQETGNSIYIVTYSNNGNYFAAGDKKGLFMMWNASTGKIIRAIKNHSSRVVDVAFSPDDKYIATSSYDGKVALWESASSGNAPVLLNDHNSWVLSIVFTPDGQNLVSASDKGKYLMVSPVNTKQMASQFCNVLDRNFTTDEWKSYIGNDIEYQQTCKKLGSLE